MVKEPEDNHWGKSSKQNQHNDYLLSFNAMLVENGYIYIRNYLNLPKNIKEKIEKILKDNNLEYISIKKENFTLAIPQFVSKNNLAKPIGKIIGHVDPKKLNIEKRYNRIHPRTYKKILNEEKIIKKAKQFAKFIRLNKKEIFNFLLRYETYGVAVDETERTLDLLENLSENKKYFKREVGPVTTFLPRNQPLYAFSCFVIIPSLMAKEVYVKPPITMDCFFFDLMKLLKIRKNFPNIHIHKKGTREEFLQKRITKINNKPVTDVVIFTGTTQNAKYLRNLFDRKTLFIANGSGHNPIVVSFDTNIKNAVFSAMRVQLYNSGQDCAGPNAILVHKKVYNKFYKELKRELKKVRFGSFNDKRNTVGPIVEYRDLKKIQELFIKNAQWLDPEFPGIIHTKFRLIEPTIITKPLKQGPNYIEQFAPVFFLQKYEKDQDLKLYFETPQYAQNAMFITLFGSSKYIDSLIDKKMFKKRILHDKWTIIKNTDLHAKGVERGTQPYGGYGNGASSFSIYGKIITKPTLPQRDIYEQLVLPFLEYEKLSQKGIHKGKSNKKAIKNHRIILTKPRKENDSKLISNFYSKRIHNMSLESTSQHWSQIIAKKISKNFPNKEVYICVSGITPSGTVHFGNLRDVMTSLAVIKQLQAEGKRTRLIFSWDDFDRFRKVPQSIENSFNKYIGLPLTSVPDPQGKYNSYAERFEKEFEQSMKDLGIKLEYRYQTQEYKSGRYDQLIIHALNHRHKIAEILLSFMSQKGKKEKRINPKEFKKNYYPVSLYSRFSGKDTVKILGYDGNVKIKYQCLETKKTDEIDITKDHIVKLSWKTDWAMRWKIEDVVFEPGGADHASPGGSYDVSSVIAKKIFNIEPPIFTGYQFVGLRGLSGKMSKSKGNVVSPGQLLKIYEAPLLKWLYLSKTPNSVFTLAFDSEIYRQYDEFDIEVKKYKKNKLALPHKQGLELSIGTEKFYTNPIPFRQAVALGQIVQWNLEKTISLLKKLNLNYDKESIKSRLIRGHTWLEIYNPNQIISLLENINQEYLKQMSPKAIKHVGELKKTLEQGISSIEKLEKIVYSIPKDSKLSLKENELLQRAFFKDVYNLLFGNDQGPRLATFLWAVGRKKILRLLGV